MSCVDVGALPTYDVQVNQGLGSPLSRGQLAALAAHASRHGEVEPGTRRREAMIDYELFLDSFSSASPNFSPEAYRKCA